MKNITLTICCFIVTACCFSQTVEQKIKFAYQQFEADSQMRHAISSLYVIDAATGQVVFDKNSQVGLAPASTQKIITSVTAFELLGKDFRYSTQVSYDGEIRSGSLVGNIYLQGSGDPTFGSWRYRSTRSETITDLFITELRKKKISNHRGSLIALSRNNDVGVSIPDGWLWQDIGNYYGAAASDLNWNENQYDLILRPGKSIGDSVKLVRTTPEITQNLMSHVRSGPKNSGDNAYIYFNPSHNNLQVKGTVPCCVDSFKISGAVPDGNLFTLNHFAGVLWNYFKEEHVSFHLGAWSKVDSARLRPLFIHQSPSLDSIIYWFNKRSINLYGEALIKTIAYEKIGFPSTDSGTGIVRKFWKEKGLDEEELNIYDGSGLSPLNRVTTHAQVEILKYAKTRDWFPYFMDALPEFNSMKLKSGTISDVKGFCGYHKSREGREYIISFLVNNYSGRSSQLVNKMYKVLDVLK
jgi:D-alanyl-D-alanine carboxypeptidase/D-alanyl-D-alanine-endopeptidase (penicillin-binding protein 4)